MQVDQPPPFGDVDGLSTPQRRIIRHAPTYDADRLVAFVLSRSQCILMADEGRSELIDRLRALLPAGEFPLPLVCEVWRGERR